MHRKNASAGREAWLADSVGWIHRIVAAVNGVSIYDARNDDDKATIACLR
jgi:hypothetical protein